MHQTLQNVVLAQALFSQVSCWSPSVIQTGITDARQLSSVPGMAPSKVFAGMQVVELHSQPPIHLTHSQRQQQCLSMFNARG